MRLPSGRRLPAAKKMPAAHNPRTDNPENPNFTHDAEMGFTHRELLAALPQAVAPFVIEPIDRPNFSNPPNKTFRLHHAAQRVLLTLQPETTRTIAALEIPLTVVKLEFFGFDQAAYAQFMAQYKRHLHKGGG